MKEKGVRGHQCFSLTGLGLRITARTPRAPVGLRGWALPAVCPRMRGGAGIGCKDGSDLGLWITQEVWIYPVSSKNQEQTHFHGCLLP